MNKHLKHLMIATSAAVLLSTPALACGGKACPSQDCDFQGVKAQDCPIGSAKSSGYKKSGHDNIPGNKPSYIRKILKKGDAIALTDKQRKQIGDLLIAAETAAARTHAEAQITVSDFRSKMHAGELSDADIKAYTKRMGELRTAKFQANLAASVKASRLLSAEQKTKLYAGK